MNKFLFQQFAGLVIFFAGCLEQAYGSPLGSVPSPPYKEAPEADHHDIERHFMQGLDIHQPLNCDTLSTLGRLVYIQQASLDNYVNYANLFSQFVFSPPDYHRCKGVVKDLFVDALENALIEDPLAINKPCGKNLHSVIEPFLFRYQALANDYFDKYEQDPDSPWLYHQLERLEDVAESACLMAGVGFEIPETLSMWQEKILQGIPSHKRHHTHERTWTLDHVMSSRVPDESEFLILPKDMLKCMKDSAVSRAETPSGWASRLSHLPDWDITAEGSLAWRTDAANCVIHFCSTLNNVKCQLISFIERLADYPSPEHFINDLMNYNERNKSKGINRSNHNTSGNFIKYRSTRSPESHIQNTVFINSEHGEQTEHPELIALLHNIVDDHTGEKMRLNPIPEHQDRHAQRTGRDIQGRNIRILDTHFYFPDKSITDQDSSNLVRKVRSTRTKQANEEIASSRRRKTDSRNTKGAERRGTRIRGHQNFHLEVDSQTYKMEIETAGQTLNIWKKRADPEVDFGQYNNNGVFTIARPGLYFIYSQMTYYDNSGRWCHAIKKNSDLITKCLASEWGMSIDSGTNQYVPTVHNCFTSIAVYLDRQDEISIISLYGRRTAHQGENMTYWGIVRLGDGGR